MQESAVLNQFTTQIPQIKAALRSILQLDRRISSDTEVLDNEVAAAINKAFVEHAPSFEYTEQSNTLDAKFKVDLAIKEVCADVVKQASEAKQHVMHFCVQGAVLPSVPQLLDLARFLSQILLAETTLFLTLISDLVEICTIDEGTDIFLYLERCVPLMKSKFNFEPQGAAPKLAVLRICNMLLKRISRSQHVLLAGRIHLFLSQILPSTDRSAVNANGMVNDSHAIEIEDVPEGFLDTDGNPVNVDFYKKFWSLQQVFQNPVRATDPNLWLQVYANIKAVLAEFAKVRPTVASGGAQTASASQQGLTVKYLSSPKLLHLQLRDAGFRRHFLMQCLILLQSGAVKSLNKQETFRIKQQGEADDLQELVYKELEHTPQHGQYFAKASRALMHHEDRWAEWKAGGAKSFERQKRPLDSVDESAEKRRRMSKTKNVHLGKKELTRLWNLSVDNRSAAQRGRRRPIPSLREFIDPVVQEMDPADCIEEQYKKKGDMVYQWEALRQISKVSPVDLSAIGKTKGQDLEEAVRLMFPEDVPPGAEKHAEPQRPSADVSALGAPPSPGPHLLNETTRVTTSADAPTKSEEGSEITGLRKGLEDDGAKPSSASAKLEENKVDSETVKTPHPVIDGDAEKAVTSEDVSVKSLGQIQGGESHTLEEGKQISLGNSYLTLGSDKSSIPEVAKE